MKSFTWQEKFMIFVCGATLGACLWFFIALCTGGIPLRKNAVVIHDWEPKQMLCRTTAGPGAFGARETCIDIHTRSR